MFRFILICIEIFFFFIFTIPVFLYMKLISKKNPDKAARICTVTIRWILKLILKTGGVRLHVKGLENIPEDPVLYVSNHRGMFDIITGMVCVNREVGFIAKKELGNIPFFSKYVTNMRCLFLDRQDLKQGLQIILQAIDFVKAGHSMWIFPEGTRSHTDEMLEFKEGSFKIAERTGCPIVPVAFTGTDDIFENHFPKVKPGDVYMSVGKPIMVADLKRNERKFLGRQSREVIQEMIDEQKKERDGVQA